MNFIERLQQALNLKRKEDIDPWTADKLDIPAEVADDRPTPLPATTKPAADWTNPQMRVELPPDFPPPLHHGQDVTEIAKIIDRELHKHGTSLKDVERIHIVYPHKHPGLFPGHDDSATYYAKKFAAQMTHPGSPASNILWNVAKELVETQRLGRSEDQSSVHALTAKQQYAFDFTPGESSTLALMGDNRKEFFVVVDHMSEQGTTFANLISHVRANGGVVVATVGSGRLLQEADDKHEQRSAQLPSKFTDPSRNDGKLASLGLALQKSAKESGMDWTPGECVEMLNDALKKNGNSVFAMTNGEVQRVIDSVTHNHRDSTSFVGMLKKLEEKAEAAAAVPAKQAATSHKAKHPRPGS